MTTIVSTLEMMAADSQVSIDDTRHYDTEKLIRFEDAIIGVAGDVSYTNRFLQWWPQRKRSPLKLPKNADCEALVLTADGLFYFSDGVERPDKIKGDMMAIGSGAALALIALDTMRALGHDLDPRLAIELVRQRDNATGGDVDFMELT